MAVAHAVEAREVGARLRGRDHVVDGHGVFGVRQRHLHELRARGLARLHRLVRDALHLGVEPGEAVVFLRQADLHALERRALERGHVVGHGFARRGAVHLVVAGERLQQNRRVLHALRHRAHLVEGARERGHAVAAHAPVARLEAHAVAEARRLADRAARIRAERGDAEVAAHRRRAAARAAAGHARDVVGVHRAAERGVLRGGAHRELVHVHAPRADEVVRLEVCDHGRVVGRDVALQDLRRARAGLALHVDEILDRDRHRLRVRPRRRERALLVEREIRPDARILRMHAVDHRLHELHAREVALRQALAGRLDAKLVQIHVLFLPPSTKDGGSAPPNPAQGTACGG